MATHKLRYKVLIIEDDEDALIVRDTLDTLSESESDSVEYAERLRTRLECLANEKFDIIPLDLSLTDSIDLNILEKLLDKVSEVPVIVFKQKLLEEMQNISYRFLKLANQHTEIIPLLNEFVKEIHEFTACEAIGVRILDENGSIPYMAYKGFSPEFYELESPLSIHSDHCMCINVINGETDPKLPYFTEGGSFYINGTTKFLATVSEEDKGQTRNECNRVGYESVALIPICITDSIVGLIHVSDRQEND
jgi:hypothetical protein